MLQSQQKQTHGPTHEKDREVALTHLEPAQVDILRRLILEQNRLFTCCRRHFYPILAATAEKPSHGLYEISEESLWYAVRCVMGYLTDAMHGEECPRSELDGVDPMAADELLRTLNNTYEALVGTRSTWLN
jgi:hypothetical protein